MTARMEFGAPLAARPTRWTRHLLRTVTALSAGAALAWGLVGCSSTPNDAVTVTGDFGTAAAISVDGTLSPSGVTTKTLIQGDGDTIADDGNAEVGLAVYDPTNQQDLVTYSTSYSLDEWTQYFSPLADAVHGQQIGTRVSLVGQALDLVGEGNASSYFSLEDSDPLVVVADVIDAVQAEDPETTDTFTDADFPTVTLDDAGTPTTMITTGVTPSTTQVKVIKEGNGTVVAEGDTVSFNYQLTRLRDGKEIESDYGEDAASSTASADGLIAGFAKAIVGQHVGSTVLAVVPPSEGYGDSDGSTLQHETLVFVFTVTDTTAASK